MLIAGVDDAGRGPVLGPLVLAGVLFIDTDIPKLQKLGVKDSKSLTPKRREILCREIKKLAIRWKTVKLGPLEIDKVVLKGIKLHRLNWLEAKAMAEVINSLHPEIAYIDASDVNEARFAQQIRENIHFELKMVSEHYADANYVIVGAASIIAKVHRDKEITRLKEVYGDLGSGYPSDPKTRHFLLESISKGEIPPCIRKSWKTVKVLTEAIRQKTLQ